VLRLASLLWRLRRIVAIETDLFAIQAEILRDRRNEMTTVHGELESRTMSPNGVTRFCRCMAYAHRPTSVMCSGSAVPIHGKQV
jgi:hypothetical protein